MKLLIALLFIIFVIWASFEFWHRVVAPKLVERRAAKDAESPWKVHEIEQPEGTQVVLVKPGQKALPVGKPVSRDQPIWDYTEAYEGRIMEAEDLALVKNR